MRFIYIVLITIILCTCKTSPSDDIMQAACDSFYAENLNEEVLELCEQGFKNEKLHKHDRIVLQLFELAAHGELGNLSKADSLFTNIDTTAVHNHKKLIYWYNSIGGLYYFRKNNYPKSLQMLNKSVEQNISEKANAQSYRLMARIHFSTGDANKASEFLAQSTELFSKTKLHKSVGINHKILGRQFAAKQDFNAAEKHFDIAIKAIAKSNDSLELFYVYINMLDLQLRQKNYQKAKEQAIKSEKYISQKTDNQALALLYNNFAEIEFLLNNLDSCKYYYHKTLELPTGFITENLRRGNACIGMSKAYLAQNDAANACEWALKALNISMLSNNAEVQHNANVQLSTIYNLQGNSNAAYHHLMSANNYLQNLANESRKNTETVYQSTIQLIKAQNEAQEIKAEKQLYIFMLIAGFVFFILIATYGVNTYRLLRSRNKTLKVLVDKNLQIIEDERKLNMALQQRIAFKINNKRISEEEKHIHLYSECLQWLSTNKNFARRDLNADTVARELNTNRDYLARAMAEQNTRFNELLSKMRVDEAIKILTSKCDKRRSYNLNIIAAEVGFNSNSVFIDAFRKQTGMTPAQFRATACIDSATPSTTTQQTT